MTASLTGGPPANVYRSYLVRFWQSRPLAGFGSLCADRQHWAVWRCKELDRLSAN